MKDIALRDIFVLAICVVLIAGGALFYLTGQSSNQESVSLEPIQAVPMRVPNASDSAPQPPARLRTPDRLEPRAATSPVPASSAASSGTVSSSATSSDSASNASTSDSTVSDATVPEPSERPSDAATPSDATLPSSDPASDSSSTASGSTASGNTAATIAAATPSALPVRNSAQGWAVQAGAFKNAGNATGLRDRLLKLGLAARVEVGADGVNRVLVGAYSSAAAAKASSATVAAALK